MKIYFVSSMADGCQLYRVSNPANYSKHNTYVDINLETSEWERDFERLIDSDIIIFHRPYTKDRLEMMKLLKLKGKTVGFDNDDTFRDITGIPVEKHLDPDTLEKCLRIADFATVSTQVLVDEYKKFNKNTFLLKNLIDFKRIPDAQRNKGKKTRILISGSTLIMDGRGEFKAVKDWLLQREDVQLVIFGLSSKKEIKKHKLKTLRESARYWLDNKIEWHNYIRPHLYFQKLADLQIDIAVIPRLDRYFNKAKSNLKYLEMSALKIPTIAQSFANNDSPYDLIKTEGAPILLAKTIDDWKQQIDRLIKDKNERVKLGELAYDFVYRKYNTELNNFDKIICQLKE